MRPAPRGAAFWILCSPRLSVCLLAVEHLLHLWLPICPSASVLRQKGLVANVGREQAGSKHTEHSLITDRIRTVSAFAGTKNPTLLSRPSRLAELPALTSDQGQAAEMRRSLHGTRCNPGCCTHAHAQPAAGYTSLCTRALRASSATARAACERWASGILTSRGAGGERGRELLFCSC